MVGDLSFMCPEFIQDKKSSNWGDDHLHLEDLPQVFLQRRISKIGPSSRFHPFSFINVTEVEGLKRKLNGKLGANSPALQPDWQIGQCVAVRWRPNFETIMFIVTNNGSGHNVAGLR
ncbi:Pre-mRNA cleavage factor Im 25 kDa subunit 2 [Camellia lanceoleosa]|uniref:Pre-mRNA cleavage factor Im 25 kDa subunit 2 n=1 Tax=Camellia lanceoleosa TaxID=1840588 RepID=A0ACC0IAX6_9ERIC|nr:Pre-mRNA cleavage factor Im 25 kDa subunit 2 [Camellia lanceoleosa]